MEAEPRPLPASGVDALAGPGDDVAPAGRSGAVAHPSARQTRTVAGPLTGDGAYRTRRSANGRSCSRSVNDSVRANRAASAPATAATATSWYMMTSW